MITHMKPQPIGPLIPFRAGLLTLVLVIVVLLLAWFLAPAFPGYHIGHDVCTGHEWLSRVFQGARSWFSMMRGGLIGRGRLKRKQATCASSERLMAGSLVFWSRASSCRMCRRRAAPSRGSMPTGASGRQPMRDRDRAVPIFDPALESTGGAPGTAPPRTSGGHPCCGWPSLEEPGGVIPARKRLLKLPDRAAHLHGRTGAQAVVDLPADFVRQRIQAQSALGEFGRAVCWLPAAVALGGGHAPILCHASSPFRKLGS